MEIRGEWASLKISHIPRAPQAGQTDRLAHYHTHTHESNMDAPVGSEARSLALSSRYWKLGALRPAAIDHAAAYALRPLEIWIGNANVVETRHGAQKYFVNRGVGRPAMNECVCLTLLSKLISVTIDHYYYYFHLKLLSISRHCCLLVLYFLLNKNN